MRRRIEWLVRNPRVQGAGDAVLALVLAVLSVVPVLGGDLSWGRPKPLALTLALVSTVPVAWRARRPLLAAAIVLAANGACLYAAAPHQAAFQPFVALTLVAYSVGSRAEGRRALWVPPALALAAVPLFAAAVAHGQDAGNAFPSYVWLVAAWAVGRSVRSWRHKSVALELANRELDQQRELQAQAAVTVEFRLSSSPTKAASSAPARPRSGPDFSSSGPLHAPPFSYAQLALGQARRRASSQASRPGK